jgi:predicted ATPase
VDVRILGPLELWRDGCPVDLPGTRLRALLARLALDAGRPVTTGALADAVWDGGAPAGETHALQSLVSRLRSRLGAADLVTPAAGGGYRLDLPPEAIDAHRFAALAADGATALRDGDPARALALLRQALDLWRGPALADLADHRFAAAAAGPLQERRLTALGDRMAAELALGHGARLVAELEALAAEHPLNERFAAQLLAALQASGRPSEALAAYERTRRRLDAELGAVPGPELQAAHLTVLNGGVTGSAPSPPPTAPDPTAADPPEPAPEPVRRRTNLPAAVTSFVGRDREIAELDGLLQRSRLVTLLGPGGTGKTRLARETASRWVDRVDDGVWMVELAPITDPIEIVPAVFGALGLRETAPREVRLPSVRREGMDRLLDLLAEREVVLVLDNCEHLIAPAAELSDELLAHCPRLRILTTSREPLAIAGESLFPVSPLELPAPDATAEEALVHPAIRLLRDRAVAVQPGFAIDATTVAAAVEVCRRLDGLPLAIELAAARLRALPIGELAQRLDDRFRLLTGGSRTALPRHRTLRAVVDWSWELLDEPERRLVRRLAAFPGGATLESAAAVCADPGATGVDVLDGLATLTDRSLLVTVPDADPPRWRMLETIREYGLERLAEAGEADAIRDAHAAWFAELAARADPQLRGPDQLRWFRLLDAERENVVAALRRLGDRGQAREALQMANALIWFWVLAGAQAEATALLGFAASVPGDADPVDRLVAHTAAAFNGARESGNPEGLKAVLADLTEDIDAIDDADRPLIAVVKPILALFSGDDEIALQRMEEAQGHRDPWVRAMALLMAGAAAENRGDTETMHARLSAALDAFDAIGDGWATAMVLIMDAGRRINAGDLDGAEVAVERSASGWHAFRPDALSWMVHQRRADIAMRRGDFPGAVAHARRARDHGDVDSDDRAVLQASIARVAMLAGDLDTAGAEVEEALELLERAGAVMPGQTHARASLLAIAASVAIRLGDLEKAEGRMVDAYAGALEADDMPIVAGVGVVSAELAAARGRPLDAAEVLGAAAQLRGAEDATNPEIVELRAALADAIGADALAGAYERGRALPRDAAIARVAPRVSSGSDATSVGA